MARMEDGRVLSAGEICADGRWPRRHHRQAGGGLAGGTGGVWAALALGGVTRRAGTGADTVGGGQRGALDLEAGPGPLAGGAELLDFYHASQHLWELGRALHGAEETAAARWVEPLRHQLRHGGEHRVLAQIAALSVSPGDAGKVVTREQNYFTSHVGRMYYRGLHRRGWPIGSGAVESACRQRQCWFKRPGQFWTRQGMQHLAALTEARFNNHWDELWAAN